MSGTADVVVFGAPAAGSGEPAAGSVAAGPDWPDGRAAAGAGSDRSRPDDSRAEGRPERLRCDAARNRERVLSAALDLYSGRGAAFTMEEIAARAGVGIGTVYRRFPTKQALLDAIAVPFFENLLTRAREAALVGDPANGFELFIRAVTEDQAAGGINTGRLWDAALGHPVREQISPAVGELIDAAQRGGRLRDGITYQDVSVLFWTVSALIDVTGTLSPAVWRRHLDLLLDGLRPPGARGSRITATSATDWNRLVAATPVLRLR